MLQEGQFRMIGIASFPLHDARAGASVATVISFIAQCEGRVAEPANKSRALYFRMNTGRCIGLVGGLGVGATVHYYSKLAEKHKRKNLLLDLVMAHAEASEGLRLISAGDRAGLAAYLAGFLRRLAAAGAEFAVIPAVTPHYCIDELSPLSPVPILNIFDPLREHLSRLSIRKIAVFGTRFVMGSDLFGMVTGVEFVRARPDELDAIHRMYWTLVESGRGSAEIYDGLTRLAQTFVSRDGADAILLAGTDLALVFNETNTDFPAIDCAALHLDAVGKAALTGRDS
jgi:aspartate racemase